MTFFIKTFKISIIMKSFIKNFLIAIAYLLVYVAITFAVTISALIIIVAQSSHNLLAQANSMAELIDVISFLALDYIVDNAMMLTIIANIITLLSYYIILKIRNSPIKERLDLKRVPFKKLWPVIPLGLSLNFFISYILDLLYIPENIMKEYTQSVSLIDNTDFIITFIAAVIVAPVFEEVLTRGLIFKSLQRGMPTVIALIIQSLIFGLMHGQILWISYATVFGLILGIIKLRYESLYACILLHSSINISSYIVEPVINAVSGNTTIQAILFLLSIAITILLLAVIYNKKNKAKH